MPPTHTPTPIWCRYFFRNIFLAPGSSLYMYMWQRDQPRTTQLFSKVVVPRRCKLLFISTPTLFVNFHDEFIYIKGFSWGGYGFADRFIILTYLCPIIQQQTIYWRILPKFHPRSAFWVIFPHINRFSFPQPQRFELPSLMGFALLCCTINTMLNAAFLFWWGYDGELQKSYCNMSIPKRQRNFVYHIIQRVSIKVPQFNEKY